MLVSLIVAMDRNRLIGNRTGLPWHLSADLKRFRKLTTGKPVIMGRKTFEHLGKPLPDRLNIVISRQPDYLVPGCIVLHSLEEALLTAWAALPHLRQEEIRRQQGEVVCQARRRQEIQTAKEIAV